MRRWQDDRGSASAELALVTPLLVLLLVLVAVPIHRGVDTRLLISDAAHQAARAASLARTAADAITAADTTARTALANAGISCRQLDVDIDTSRFTPGGNVTVTLTCTIDLTDAAPLPLPATRRLTTTFTEPIDQWRAINPAGSQP